MAEENHRLLDVRGSDSHERNIYFNDNTRRVDFILAYLVEDEVTEERIEKYRETYLKNLQAFHLELEEGERSTSKSKEGTVHFIKVHAPIEVLYDSAEDMKMKMPTKPYDVNVPEWYADNIFYRTLDRCNPFKLHRPETNKPISYFVQPFNKERLSEFVNHDRPDLFFTAADRGHLVGYILERAQYGDDPTDIGIESLVYKGVFLDAYPLHDGPLRERRTDVPTNNRQKLQADWATIRSLWRYQPIDAIKDYFGEKIALYFAWLGFYTTFLLPAAVAGIICFIYGVVSAVDSPLVREACSDPTDVNGTGHLFYMCPLCDKQCSYFLLNITCLYAKASNTFDNEVTPYFAAFMTIWATLFLEFWKRYQEWLAYEWHSKGFDEVEGLVRPEYTVSDTILRPNPVTGRLQPYMLRRKKIARLFGTFGVVTFFIMLVVITVFGVIVFRAVLSVTLVASDHIIVRERSKTIVSITAGLLNLVAIYILKFVYRKVAVQLTDWENPRTKTDYENSFTIKMFWFQFFNTYSSLFYLAFLKSDTFVGSPGRYRRFGAHNVRMEGCSAQGCFLELSIQMIIIMAGNVLGNIYETVVPTSMKWWRDKKAREQQDVITDEPQWVDDYRGQMQTKFSLFWGYSEIVLQYGFLTMFVAAFPLAPFFALLSNIIEIRVDAYNYIHNFRRPLAQRAEKIGAWYNILATITSVSILVNALVIAFTSELIPRLVFRHTISADGSMKGFTDWSLSFFNVKDFDNQTRPLNPTAGGISEQTQCRYPGYHETSYPYDRTIDYWLMLAYRLIFVLVFVVAMIFLSWAIAYIIPDIPKSLVIKIKREKYLEQLADIGYKERQGKRNIRACVHRGSRVMDSETTVTA